MTTDNIKLSGEEIDEVVDYTIRKIESFPKEWGYTVENYLDILLPDEIKNYIFSRKIQNLVRLCPMC